MTTRYLASAVLMKMACMLKRLANNVVVEWTPRTANTEADSLAKGTRAFGLAKRIPIAAENIHWEIHPEVLEMGKCAEEDMQRVRELGLKNNQLRTHTRRKEGDRLRVTDPWQS